MIRWLFIAALAAEILLLVPPGRVPLFGWHLPDAHEPTRLEAEVEARGDALRGAIFDRDVAAAEVELSPWLRADGPGVEVLTRDEGRLVVDRDRTAYAARLWAELPARATGVRTLFVPAERGFRGGWRPAGAGGVCVVLWARQEGPHPDRSEELGGSSGLCGVYAAFGPPGGTVTRWLARRRARGFGLQDLIRPGTVRRRTAPDPEDVSPWERLLGWSFYSGWGFSTNIRALDVVACARGRSDRCRSGFAIDDSMTAGGDRYGSFIEPLALMVSHLQPGQLQAVWRTERPLAEAFRDATGSPIEERLLAWTSGTFVARPRGGTEGPALLGAFLWLGLLGGWGALRYIGR
ncbi:MAG TPA: hypothetical protein VFI13_08435 [Gemmatimonadales bacterium]|nr:hypothetical protein [Gemmatimonadales bacterium]